MKKISKNNDLYVKIAELLQIAKQTVVRSVNQTMVCTYFEIGRMIVEDEQDGKHRAAYGKQVLKELSSRLASEFGKGFSVDNLQNMRVFYMHFSNYETTSRNFELSWSHYRALMQVTKQEAITSNWDKRTLERQIHSFYYERLLKSQNPQKMLQVARKEIIEKPAVIESLKNPMVLEFLRLPEEPTLQESQLESAIIVHLQSFLLELGKGFSFVARQKRMRFDEKDLYVDLVFYNCILKCYLLIDLKMGELSHQDVGQMDGYVRMFDDLHTAVDDNPTIGLILCTEKNEAVAKYSVLKDRKTIFASKYILYLPTEKELMIELARERKLIEEKLAEGSE